MTEKNVLTIEKLVKTQKKKKSQLIGFFIFWLLICIVLLGVTIADIINPGILSNKSTSGLSNIFGIIFFLGFLFIFKKAIDNKNKEISIIENGNFKIVEDKIYDKRYHSTGSGTRKHRYYSIFTKIYGKIDTNKHVYSQCEKDDFIYLFFYDVDSNTTHYGSNKFSFTMNSAGHHNAKTAETERRIQNTEYLASEYTLSDELMLRFIPYNEALAESNFDTQIEQKTEVAQKIKTITKCKNCGKTFNYKNHKTCPNCDHIYQFDVTDVMHKKEWYN